MARESDRRRSALDGAELERWASTRRSYLDNLKVVLIAAIIALHGVLGYAGIVEAWTYSELREVTLAPVVEVALLVLASPFGFFLIALLFLVAGLLTPSSYDRKDAKRFVADRLLRLGVPFVVYVFLIQPTLVYALEHPLGDAPGSYWREYLGAERQIDTGPLWFVGVLLLYSLGYAGWRRWADRAERSAPPTRMITLKTLVLMAAVVAPTSFAIRLVYPYGSESGFSDLNLWEWPACLAVFALGIAGSRRGWLEAIPDGLALRCRRLTLFAVVAMAVLLSVAGSLDAVDDVLGGWHWLGGVFAVVEAMLTVFGSVWLLSAAQRRLSRWYSWGPALSRSAYAAFVLQTAVLLALAVALRPLGLPAEVKAPVVAVGGVIGSFAAARFLIAKVPGVARIL
ncbi:acyltransferase family protein [Kribbella shirazensis]|uniref:Fucose 4-O-acetylase-like acetyltransferase n=1 Tax=Kribbella shirazensis TaxID=1105143 RepID=A0A7X5VDX4_9ACTN|nr:acyltransferase [Kribbella shirazensis]NIK59219.1 fucose 4-O-acetylase-like acetyltransferase [Kribbella shirazensis]